MRRGGVWIAAAALICVIGTGVVAVGFWNSIGGAGISVAGWVAMVLGAVLSLALGIGLMALVFYSSRRGYDEIGRDDRG